MVVETNLNDTNIEQFLERLGKRLSDFSKLEKTKSDVEVDLHIVSTDNDTGD